MAPVDGGSSGLARMARPASRVAPCWFGQPMDRLIVADFDMVGSLADRVTSCAFVHVHILAAVHTWTNARLHTGRSVALRGRSRPGDLTLSPPDSEIDGRQASAGRRQLPHCLTKLKPRWDLHLWGDEDWLRRHSEALPNVPEGRTDTAACPPPYAHFTLVSV